MSLSTLKWAAILSFIVAMVVLLGGGVAMKDQLPPYPGKVVDTNGKQLFTKADILAGQDIYQRYGLMDHGAVWGHGSQRGPEFSAATLHLMAQGVQNYLAFQEYGKPYDKLDDIGKAIIDVKTKKEFKTNRYDSAKDTLTLTAAQIKGLERAQKYWEKTFKEGEKRYGILPNTILTEQQRQQIARFFFWTAWVASTLRPGKDYTYTNNWPSDRLIGNVASTETYFWSIGGVLALLVVLGLFVYWIHRYGIWYGEAKGAALADKLIDLPLTPSQLKAAKFFVVVILLFLVQTSFGGLLAHYTVHPASFFLPFIAKLIPYSWAKSWHLQLMVFWIATTWVASAIYLAPIIGGREPHKQGLLVQLLFGAILLVAVGSLTGEVLGIKGLLGNMWFWFGHQGWEFLELGRLWQIMLFLGLIFWLLIVYRAVGTHLKSHKDEFSALIWFYVFSAVLVVAFFGFGLFYGRGSHLTMADYWRWFVVHLWVESIFEFFGIAVIAVLMVAMGLATATAALRVAYFTAAITFLSGIIGTAHHYFWYGGPSFWVGWGAIFSSMEPVPLMTLVVRGLMEYRDIRKAGYEFPYKWPLFFLVASSFWNFWGAGVFGFLINLPIINYYEHGTYLTMNHGHAAMFGTYGMLSVALLLFSWRGLVEKAHWKDGILKLSFWGLNGGLFLMTMGTLLPIGAMQVWTSFKNGLWVARSASFFERGAVSIIGNLRVIPDVIIIVLGVIPLAYFLLTTYPKLKAIEIKEGESVWERLGIEL
ncbi:MAG: cbb3-type cytochrome c oxidase subunit I [Deltaproteobacteria bacterium]|nr:cbb3-type cytochrome c oxidase subunit I [Deltaproteobacteria bacterium]MBW2151800.1 cbb3-type cytochrome c oxidase subunit I [Deltaproteobacteria bacterium]